MPRRRVGQLRDSTRPGIGLTTTNAGNTLRLAVRPLDDYTLLTASGNDYTPDGVGSVPEPEGLVMTGSVAMLLRLVRRRRWRS